MQRQHGDSLQQGRWRRKLSHCKLINVLKVEKHKSHCSLMEVNSFSDFIHFVVPFKYILNKGNIQSVCPINEILNNRQRRINTKYYLKNLSSDRLKIFHNTVTYHDLNTLTYLSVNTI